MQKPDKIDFAKLLGFDAVNDQLLAGVDFQDETIAARLGAKVELGGDGHRLRADEQHKLTKI